jgi:hypothetical protein
MSSAYVLPFNFQPANVSVKSSSYTVPSGKYGLLVLLNKPIRGSNLNLGTNSSGTKFVQESECMMFINGVSAIPMSYSVDTNMTIVANGTTRQAMVYMPESYGACQIMAKQNATLNGFETGGISIGWNGPILYAGINGSLVGNGNWGSQTYQNALNGGPFTSGAAYSFEPSKVPGDFWLKSGDVIGVPSGGQYLFIEYNSIS